MDANGDATRDHSHQQRVVIPPLNSTPRTAKVINLVHSTLSSSMQQEEKPRSSRARVEARAGGRTLAGAVCRRRRTIREPLDGALRKFQARQAEDGPLRRRRQRRRLSDASSGKKKKKNERTRRDIPSSFFISTYTGAAAPRWLKIPLFPDTFTMAMAHGAHTAPRAAACLAHANSKQRNTPKAHYSGTQILRVTRSHKTTKTILGTHE